MSKAQQSSSEDQFAPEEKIEFQLSVQVDPDLIKNFPPDVAQDFGVLQLGRFGEESLVLAAEQELSASRVKELRKRLGGQGVHIVPSSGSQVPTLAESIFNQDGAGQPSDQPSEVVPATESDQEALEYAEQSKYDTEPKKLSQILIDLGFLSKKELRARMKEQRTGVIPTSIPPLLSMPRSYDLFRRNWLEIIRFCPSRKSWGTCWWPAQVIPTPLWFQRSGR